MSCAVPLPTGPWLHRATRPFAASWVRRATRPFAASGRHRGARPCTASWRRHAAWSCAIAVGFAIAACSKAPAGPPAGTPEALAVYLQGILGADDAIRQREVASWQLDAALWERTVVAPYRSLHADYQRAFAAEAPALVARLAHGGAVTARRHYAGDPRLTLSQGRDRWALPPLYPSLVAEAGGAPIEAVFVPDGARWRALVGLDAALRAHVTALDPGCAANLARAGATGGCTDVGAAIAFAALRTDREQLAHVCRLAETLCGKGSP